MATMNLPSCNRKIYFLTTDLRVIMASTVAKLQGRFVFLPQLMAICHCWVTKHAFLTMQALVTWCQRLAGQNTCSFAEIIHTSNLYGEYMTACMCPWCKFVPAVGMGANRWTNPSQKFPIQTGLGLRFITNHWDSTKVTRWWRILYYWIEYFMNYDKSSLEPEINVLPWNY